MSLLNSCIIKIYKMKRLLLLMQMLIAFAAGISAETLTVCDGTAVNADVPFAGAYNQDGDITSQMIYPAADLTALTGKKITSITFYPNSALSWTNTDTWSVAEVEQTSFSSSALATPAFTQVAVTKGVKNADNSWTIEFDAPYVYNGGNLMIQGVMPKGYDGNQQFYGVNQTDYTSCVKYNDWGDWTTSRVRFLPKVTFAYEEETTEPVDPSTPSVATFDFLANPWGHAWGSGSAGQASFDAGNVTEPLVADGVSLSFDSTNASTPARFWNQRDFRPYANTVVTVAAPEGKAISKIEITAAGDTYVGVAAPFAVAGATATLTLDEAVASYEFTIASNARWTSMEVTLVPAAEVTPEPEPFVIPEGYHEVENWKEIFTGFPYTISSTGLSLGWNYIDCQADYSGMFTRSTYYSVEGGSCLNITNTSTYTNVDYVVSPAVKGEVAIKARALSSAASYAGTQYVKFYKVTRNEDGTFNAPTEADLIKEEALSLTSFVDIAIGNFDDYTYIAITGSRVYLDVMTATSAVMPENPALQVTAIASEWTDNNKLYADAEGKFTWTGTFKVKNTGDVDLVAGRDNYSVTVTSQSTGQITIPETVIPISVDLAVGEESEDIELTLECTLVDQTKTESRTAIRVTSNLLAYGAVNTSSQYYKQSSWFTAVSYAPSLKVWTEGSSSLDERGVDLGLAAGSVSKAISVKNAGGSDAVITAINSTFAEGFSTDAELPLTIAPNETKEINFIVGGNAGYKEGTVTFVYGDNFEYTTKNISATVVPEGTYLETFGTALTPEKTFVPGGWVNEGGSNWEAAASSSNIYMQNTQQAYPEAMLISPKVTFAEGDALTIGATSRTSSFYSSTDAYLQVYYSTDRQNWTLANVITYDGTKKSATEDVYANTIDAEKVIAWGTINGTTVDKIKAYTIDGIPAGDYYIGFRSGYALIDYIFGGTLANVENDLYIDEFKVEAGQAMVNYPVTATVDYANLTDHVAADHTVALYDGDTLIEEKTADEVAAYAKASATFTFTPHVASEMNLKAVIKNVEGDYSVETEVKTVNIKEETFVSEGMAGEHTNTFANNSVPFYLNYYNSRGEWIWKSEEMTISNGDMLNSITLFYYSTGKDLSNKNVRVYIANTDDTNVGTVMTDVATMTEVFADDSYTFVKAGSSTAPAELTFSFSAPFEYTGSNLRVVMISEDEAKAGYAQYYFERYVGETGQSNINYNDDYSKYAASTSATRKSDVPVARFGVVAQAPVLSGTITDVEGPIECATVTVKSGNVVYTATTDADGHYSIEIMQPTLEYVITISVDGVDGYNSDAMTISEDTTFDHKFEVATGIRNINVATENDVRYNLAGQRVSASHRGIIISNGRKYIKK